ncbi:MAG: glycosyltransferase family 4 protein [Nostocoides sp.]
MPARICHVIVTDKFAGVERHTALLAVAQQRAGHDVTIIGGRPDWMAQLLAGTGVASVAGRSVLSAAVLLRTLGPWDVVNAHMTSAEAAGALGSIRAEHTVIATRHFARRRASRSGRSLAASLIASTIDGQIAVSHHVARHIDGASVVVHPGTSSRPNPRPTDLREPFVLLAQRLEVEKESEVGIRAFAQAGLHREGWRLRVAGDGAELSHLIDVAHLLGIGGSVDFLGRVMDIDGEMDRCSILIAPRSTEDFGLSVIEAMANRLPVIAAGSAGHLETVGAADRAALFTPGDAGQAAEQLAESAHDVNRRTAYADELLHLQRERFTVRRQEHATFEAYQAAM